MTGSTAASGHGASLLRDLSGRRLGRYEVLVQLASGGMATVYVARAQGVAGFERLVAIKVLHPHLAHDEEFISMFLDEARLAARIRHPNVVPTLDISDTQGDGFFLVMEYIEGDHLGALLREAARAHVIIPPVVAARLLMDALEGLGAAHTLRDPDGEPLGIVHRDVSPHNVLVGGDGTARITDFGVAKAEVRLSSTRDGQFKGKLSYMAPEQASSGKADQRSDLFSMGIVLWETLTGRRLFRADNNGELLNRLLHEPIVAPSTYVADAAPFDEVCARALARDPEDRFQSAEEFVVALERAAQTLGGAASPRVVGKLVRQVLGDKMEAQNERIRASMDALGRSQLKPGLLPLPEHGQSQPSQPSRSPSGSLTPSAVRPVGAENTSSEHMTLGAKPSTVEPEPAGIGTKKAKVWLAAGVGGAIVLAIIAFTVMTLGDGAEGDASRAIAAPSSAAPAGIEDEAAAPPAVIEPPSAAAVIVPDEADSDDAILSAAETSDAADEAHAAGAAEENAAEVEAADPETTSRRSRASQRRRERRAAESESTTGLRTSTDDDDLLVNPYRR